MMVSELVEVLSERKEEYGDLEVHVLSNRGEEVVLGEVVYEDSALSVKTKKVLVLYGGLDGA